MPAAWQHYSGCNCRTRQPMRHRDDGLIDQRPVLLAALSEPLRRTRSHHAVKPVRQLRKIVLKSARRRRNHEQKDADEDDHAGGGCPPPSPDQIGKYRHREHLDRGGQREHASRRPRAPALQQPEPGQHHRQQHEVRLAEIERVGNEGHRRKARQREQSRAGSPSRSRHGVGELRRHPPCRRVHQAQQRIKRQFAEPGWNCQQHRR